MPPDQICLEGRFGPPDATTSIDQREPAKHRGHGGRSVGEAVFVQLGQLDRRDDRVATRAHRDGLPGVGSVGPAAQPTKEVRAVHGDPLGRPWSIEGRGPGSPTKRGRPARASPEVGRSMR